MGLLTGLLTLPLALWILGAGGYGRVTVALAISAALVPLVLLNVPDGAARLVVSAPSPLVRLVSYTTRWPTEPVKV